MSKLIRFIVEYFRENERRKREGKYLEWYKNPRLDD